MAILCVLRFLENWTRDHFDQLSTTQQKQFIYWMVVVAIRCGQNTWTPNTIVLFHSIFIYNSLKPICKQHEFGHGFETRQYHLNQWSETTMEPYKLHNITGSIYKWELCERMFVAYWNLCTSVNLITTLFFCARNYVSSVERILWWALNCFCSLNIKLTNNNK